MWQMDPKATRALGAPALTVGADAGWKDTIQINLGEVITVRATFDLPGKYVTHCHILSREEHDMMRFMQVGPDAYPAPDVVVAAEPAAPATSFVTAFSNPPIVAAFKDNETTSIIDQGLI